MTTQTSHIRFALGSAILLLLPLLLAPAAFAQDGNGGKAPKAAEKKKKDKEEVRPGIIANTGTFVGSGAVSVQSDGASPGDDKNAISGSVSSVGRGQCSATVINSSKQNTYAVRYSVEGRNQRGLVVLNKTFTATLAPEERVTKTLSCEDNLDLQVVLKSASKRG